MQHSLNTEFLFTLLLMGKTFIKVMVGEGKKYRKINWLKNVQGNFSKYTDRHIHRERETHNRL